MNPRKKLIRGIVLDILLQKEPVEYEPFQFPYLLSGVAAVLTRREGAPQNEASLYPSSPKLSDDDSDFVREVFWDLVVEKVITIGSNPDNPELPWFKFHSEYKP